MAAMAGLCCYASLEIIGEIIMTYYSFYNSPIGKLLLTSDGENLTGLYLNEFSFEIIIRTDWREDNELSLFLETKEQLSGYFNGTLTSFNLPLSMEGTEFQQKVWRELKKIPYGITISYKELAFRIDKPKASRAVGLANGRNPIPIIVPCHRVIGANGNLVGYGGGIDRKKSLLMLEQAVKTDKLK